jgi:cytochrome b pre-mRNA-processing protein 3
MILGRLFGDSKQTATAADLYGAVVGQARRIPFYRDLGVPDTVDGRFEMIVLHMVLVLGRLRHEGDSGAALSQALFDVLLDDMDRSLRELGVGDLGVGRRVKAMAKAFYGRADAYEAALGADDGIFADALRRNLFGTVEVEDHQIAAIIAYIKRETTGLAGQSGSELLAGRVTFGAPPAEKEAGNGNT